MTFITHSTTKNTVALFVALFLSVLIAAPTVRAADTWDIPSSDSETCTTCASATGSWHDIAIPVGANSSSGNTTQANKGSWYDIATPSNTNVDSWNDIANPVNKGSWYDIAAPTPVSTNTGSWYDIAQPVANTGSWYDIATPVSKGSSFEADYRAAIGRTARTVPHVQIVQRPQTSSFELDYYNATHTAHRPVTVTPAVTKTTTTTGTGTTVINNTNTNTVNVPQQQPVVYNYQPQQPVYNYQPPVQYAQPQVTVAQTGYTPAYTYVPVSNVPYTGTSDVAYVLTLIAVALTAVAGFVYFRRDVVAAVTGMTSSPAHFTEVADENIDEVEEGAGNTADSILSLTDGENGPRLSFSRA